MTTSLITGANKGLGFETARQLVAVGHQVWMGARDADRGQQAADQLGAGFVQLDVRPVRVLHEFIPLLEKSEAPVVVNV